MSQFTADDGNSAVIFPKYRKWRNILCFKCVGLQKVQVNCPFPCLTIILIILNSKYHIVTVKTMHFYIWKTLVKCSIWIFLLLFDVTKIWWLDFLKQSSHICVLFSTVVVPNLVKRQLHLKRYLKLKIKTTIVYDNNVFCQINAQENKKVFKNMAKKLSLIHGLCFSHVRCHKWWWTVLLLTHDILWWYG